ncbi:guanine nucleotide-exchange factor SEC12-like [Tubulanus polymorphus]|uniref:guanine nucleotide-exchange factor SEC12-like n=1 Tax=Tubulanus polymorphus TaxID=672921 RepID=UPI003DA39802
MASKKGSVTIQSVDFPPYVIQMLPDRHFLVAGGGGQAKCGIPNIIEVFELKKDEDADTCYASSVCRHTTTDAIMNGATAYDGKTHYLAAGVEDQCQIYHLKYKLVKPKPNTAVDADGNVAVRKRKGNATESDDNKATRNVVSFDITLDKSVQSDFAEDGGLQNVVKFSRDHTLVITGGADGYLRIWKRAGMKRIHEIEAHKQEIEDLDISPDGNRIVTISREKKACVWNTKNGTKFADLEWPQKTEAKYRFRTCRYGIIENKKENFNLYTVNIPVTQGQKNAQSFITIWNSKDFRVKKISGTGPEIVSSFAVSNDGIYLATGTLSGSVSVFISFSLSRLYHIKDAHSIFVTGLLFLPSTEEVRSLTGAQDFSLISVSADNCIKLNQMPPRASFSAIWLLIGFVIIIYAIFWLMAELGV